MDIIEPWQSMVEKIHYPITNIPIHFNIFTIFMGCFDQGLRLSESFAFAVHTAQYFYDRTFHRFLL